MSRYVFKLPDLGEGLVEAEVLQWYVKPGDSVTEDQPVVDMMTDKASVEVPAPVSGKVISITGEPGDMLAVGSELIVFETETDAAEETAEAPAAEAAAKPEAAAPAKAAEPAKAPAPAAAPRAATGSEKILTSPAIRRIAREAGVDLGQVPGTGPRGRIQRADLEAFMASTPDAAAMQPTARAPLKGIEEIKVIGVRRVIAENLLASKRNIPHFTYIEEIDVTDLESLRVYLNSKRREGEPSLTYMPFIALALVKVLREFPQCNALYDAERGVIIRHQGIHIGIATQTPDGLKVPVLRHTEARSLADASAEIRRVSEAARTGKAKKEELSGSTITITSLGKLGGIASTPIINAPEVSIIGVARAVERPVVLDGNITIRRMMNLSSSFDHRFVDGFDGASMIQALKERLEHPATIFMDD
jgi:2-oxoisovalerate dehydrogenase E2 component (dihydrolipoyl transacylase)